MDRSRVFLIAGPTASGKSALASALADRHRGTVINADAMAVYRDLRIVTGRPTAAEAASVAHRLYGHQDAATPYSVGRWLIEVEEALAATRSEGRMGVVVGGTGLYFKALTAGLSDIPPVPPAVRERLRAETEGWKPEDLHARLLRCDPDTAARLRPTDPQRILRALEVFAATGRSLGSFQAHRSPPLLGPGSYLGLTVTPDRQILREAIDRRFDRMIADGAVDEVAALAARQLDPALPIMRALGVPPLIDYIAGRQSMSVAIERAKTQTRAYAKRQITFARHQLPEFSWIDPATAREMLGLRPS